MTVNFKKKKKKKNSNNFNLNNNLLKQLSSTILILRKNVKKKWGRVLPFGDYLIDRWEKAKYLGFGSKTSIYDSSLVIGNVKVGKNTWIGPFTILDGSGNLKIGNNCSISAGVQIYTHDTLDRYLDKSKIKLIQRKSSRKAKVTIGNDCYIGPNAIISKGVSIGDKCIVGANSFVNKSMPKNSKAWGIPAKLIK